MDRFKPTHADFDYRDYPFYWIARLDSRYKQLMEKNLKPLGITMIGWRVLMILRQHQTLSVSDISTHAVVKLSTVTKTVYGLQEKQLLSIEARASDARVSEASLTAQGLAFINDLLERTATLFDRAFDGISEQELQSVDSVMQRIYGNLEAGIGHQ